jgi:hypothetical protein
MIWQSVVMDRHPSDRELATATASLFDIALHEVLVIKDLADIRGSLDNAVHVICERASLPGRFCSQVTFIVRDDAVARRAAGRSVADALSRFCRDIDASCLLDHPDSNPYSAILVPRAGKSRSVLLDADRLDERGEHVILHDEKAARVASGL